MFATLLAAVSLVGETASPPPPLKLTLETRLRYENLSEEATVGMSQPAQDDYVLRRALVGLDWAIDGNLRVLGQLGFHDVVGQKGPLTATEESGTDIQQAFVEYRHKTLSLRAGRQEMPLGAQRLISRRDGPNIRQSFDALRVNIGGLSGFVGHPVRIGHKSFDDAANRDQTFYGLYGAFKVPPLTGMQADLYALQLERKAVRFGAVTADENRTSLGVRLSGGREAFDYDIEAVIQSGTFGSQTIQAHYVSANLGYTLTGDRAARIALKFDQASGDDGKGRLKTFNPLFPRGSYFDEAGRVGPANLVRLGSTLTLKPHRTVTLTIGADRLWRDRVSDALYRQPNLPVPATAGKSGRYTGAQAFIAGTWQVTPELSLTTHVSHLNISSRLNGIGIADSRYIGVWLGWAP
ncbi:alginate export family protein [Asticcacaulis sp.]|uniref:alginate export family protein n=1 Tax=Asticcacaulis sp. TaxID=1872648 RepID=UPI002625708D|nr:alginate export family protein [Asticcacaulis sp.]